MWICFGYPFDLLDQGFFIIVHINKNALKKKKKYISSILQFS